MQDHLVVPVAEINTVKGDIAFQSLISRRIFGLVVMFPGPLAGVPVGLDDGTVRAALTVDQHDITFIGLGLGIHQIENTLRTCQSHDDAVELHAHLIDGHGKAPVQGQKACQRTDRKAGVGIDGENAAYDRAEHIVGISQLSVDRADDIGKSIGLCRTLVEFLVKNVEIPDRLLLMAEHLDDLFSRHGLLNKAVQLTQIPLLRYKIPAGQRSDFARSQQHDAHHDKRNCGQRKAEQDHHGQDRYNRDQTVEELRDTLADHLPQRINIIRVNTHDIAVRVGVKIFDRQALHMLKELYAETLHRSLGDESHRARMCI